MLEAGVAAKETRELGPHLRVGGQRVGRRDQARTESGLQ